MNTRMISDQERVALRMVLAVLFSIVISTTSVPVAAHASTNMDVTAEAEPTAEEALKTKAEAMNLHDELRSLDTQEGVNVDEQLFTSIEYHIERGNLAFQAEEYGEAVKHYELAANQARAGLIRGYQSGAETLLDASESQVTVLKEAGYTDPEVTMLETRIQETRQELKSVEDLQSARSVYNSAEEIQRDVENLPHPRVVQLVNVLVSGWPLLVGGLLVVCIVGIWYWRTREIDTDVSVH